MYYNPNVKLLSIKIKIKKIAIMSVTMLGELFVTACKYRIEIKLHTRETELFVRGKIQFCIWEKTEVQSSFSRKLWTLSGWYRQIAVLGWNLHRLCVYVKSFSKRLIVRSFRGSPSVKTVKRIVKKKQNIHMWSL